MALPPTPSEADWPEEIAELAREEYEGVIRVIEPGKPGKYNPRTHTQEGGTPEVVVMAPRAARIQHIRLPLELAGAFEWATKRRYRFQVDLEEGDPVVTKGMVVQVLDGGRDPSLTAFTFQVSTASNSSQAAVRTIETFTEFGVGSG